MFGCGGACACTFVLGKAVKQVRVAESVLLPDSAGASTRTFCASKASKASKVGACRGRHGAACVYTCTFVLVRVLFFLR